MNKITKTKAPESIAIIGDIHGDFSWWLNAISDLNSKGHHTIQIGDFGIGFKHTDEWNRYFGGADVRHTTDVSIHTLAEMNSAFVGNHDNPESAQNSPLFLEKFGYDEATDIFWIGGAFSIDQHWRVEGESWWREEELSHAEKIRCLELYEKSKPMTVLSHDGPIDILKEMFPEYMLHEENIPSSTQNFLQHLYEIHQPTGWYFGHHHVSRHVHTETTQFQCIGEKQVLLMML